MSATSGVPVRSKTDSAALTLAFAIYGASTLTSMAGMSIGAALLAVALLAGPGGPLVLVDELKLELRTALVRRYIFLSLGLFLACVLSLIVTKIAPLEWGGRQVQALFGDLAKGWYLIWPIFLVIGLRRLNGRGRDRVLKTWLLTFGVMSGIGVLQYFTGWPRAQTIPGNESRFHATLFLGHHLSVASVLIFPFFAALDLLRRSKKLLPPAVLAGCVALGLATLFLSYSRMLWIALPLGLVLWAWGALPRRHATALVVAIALGVLAVSQVPEVRRRAGDAMGVGDRQALWKANLEFLRERPLTGAGFRRNIEASAYYQEAIHGHDSVFVSHAHNNLVDMLGGTGLIGAIAWLAWCLGIFQILGVAARRQVSYSSAFVWGGVCAWFTFHLNGLTQVNFWEGKVMHQMMWSVGWAMYWATSLESGRDDMRTQEVLS